MENLLMDISVPLRNIWSNLLFEMSFALQKICVLLWSLNKFGQTKHESWLVSLWTFLLYLIVFCAGKPEIELLANPYYRDSSKDNTSHEILDIVGIDSSYCLRAKNSSTTPKIFMDYFSDVKFKNEIRTKWKFCKWRTSKFACPKLSSDKRELDTQYKTMNSRQSKRRRFLNSLEKKSSKIPDVWFSKTNFLKRVLLCFIRRKRYYWS